MAKEFALELELGAATSKFRIRLRAVISLSHRLLTWALSISAVRPSTAAQIDVISQQLGGSGSTAQTSSFTPTREDTPVETAFNVNQVQQTQVVLVTEDLEAVTNRVSITESRASLG